MTSTDDEELAELAATYVPSAKHSEHRRGEAIYAEPRRASISCTGGESCNEPTRLKTGRYMLTHCLEPTSRTYMGNMCLCRVMWLTGFSVRRTGNLTMHWLFIQIWLCLSQIIAAG